MSIFVLGTGAPKYSIAPKSGDGSLTRSGDTARSDGGRVVTPPVRRLRRPIGVLSYVVPYGTETPNRALEAIGPRSLTALQPGSGD